MNARVEAVDGDEAADTGDTPPDAPRPPAGHDELTLLLTPVEITGRRRAGQGGEERERSAQTHGPLRAGGG